LLATSTHDTKRSEDVRARIVVISEISEVWRRSLQRWRLANRRWKRTINDATAPDANEEYLLYQTLLGTWPVNEDGTANPNISPDYVDRIQLIKRLQEDRFMPLRVIRRMVASEPERARALIELEDRIIERAVARREGERLSIAQARRRYEIPRNVLDRLAELGVLTPTSRGYDADDVKIIEAISRFRAGGYDEALGFTVYDTLRYQQALAPLVEEEVTVLLERVAGEVSVDRAVEIIASGREPLRDLIGAMHSKLLLAELRRQRDGD